jgi:hypothetical protein
MGLQNLRNFEFIMPQKALGVLLQTTSRIGRLLSSKKMGMGQIYDTKIISGNEDQFSI